MTSGGFLLHSDIRIINHPDDILRFQFLSPCPRILYRMLAIAQP
jgi:hypothetical protein